MSNDFSNIQIGNENYTVKDKQARNEIENLKAKNSEQDSKILSLTSGSPLKATSTEEMTDTTRIYVNITDGNWYYHNGSSWVSGGTYQASVNSNTVEILKDIAIKAYNIEPSWIENKYIKYTDGFERDLEPTETTTSSITEYIDVGNYEFIKIPVLYSEAGGYAFYDKNKKFISGGGKESIENYGDEKVISIPEGVKYFRITKMEINTTIENYELLFIITSNKLNNKINEFNKIKEETIDITSNLSFIENKYIHKNTGSLKSYSPSGGENYVFYATDFIECFNYTKLITQEYWRDSAGYAFYDINKNCILSSGVKNSYGSNIEIDIPENAYYFRCTKVIFNNIDNFFLNTYFNLNEMINRIIKLQYDLSKKEVNTNNLFSSFLRFGVIGDSLASGECSYTENGESKLVDLYNISWGQAIARNYGMECINFSRGGLSTRTWLTDSWGLQKLQKTENKCNAYIIGLGVNDYDKLGADYLGTIQDININDLSQNADTFYGNYGKIISNIKLVQEKAKIFILTIPNTSSNALINQYNEAIRNIAGLFNNVYLIDLYNDYTEEFQGFASSNIRNGHYNAISYQYMGNLLFNIFSDYMYKNYSEFNQIEFIGTEYSY